MSHKLSTTGTLGPISAAFIKELQRRGKTIFTLDVATEIYQKRRFETVKFLSDLVKRGVLGRIKSGIYFVLQSGQENILLNNWPILAHQLVSNEPYGISHYSAMRLHGMTTHPLIEVFITITKRHRPKKIGNIVYSFIYCKAEHFWGFHPQWITQQEKVTVSDLEKTILDGLERPDLCGGMKEVIRAIWVKQNEIDWKKLTQYCAKFRTKAAIKRLGYILELLDLGIDCQAALETLTALSKDYIFLDPDGSREGKYLSQWHLRINMNIDELKAGVWA